MIIENGPKPFQNNPDGMIIEKTGDFSFSTHKSLSFLTFSHDFYMFEVPQSLNIPNLHYQNAIDGLGRPITLAPVLRLFGTAEDSSKICVHIHGVISTPIYIFISEVGFPLFLHQIRRAGFPPELF